MELYEAIKREHVIEGKSIRLLAKEHGVHRRDVRRAVGGERPPVRKPAQRSKTVLGAVRAQIDAWLLADRDAPRKQRHTARQIWRRLCAEQDFRGAESTVRRHVGRRRRELGLLAREVFIEQEHQAGRDAEVDFGEAQVRLGGVLLTVHLLLVRCCYSGRTVVTAFRRPTQQSLLEGLCRAFSLFGGVFCRLRFDNLSAAVRRVLRGRKRVETDRFVALRAHYLFESVFCRPGKEGAHEKGGVEGEVGRFRRRHLVPIPDFDDLAALDAYLLSCCSEDRARRMEGYQETVEERWRQVAPKLRPLPGEPFDTTESLQPLVDSKSRVSILRNYYSVPTAYVGQRLSATVTTETVTITSGGMTVAAHQRLVGVHQESLVLDHYLEWLHRKPGAMAGSKVLGQARRQGLFPECYERLWEALKVRYGDADGTRHLVGVLVLLRTAEHTEVTMAVELALRHRCPDAASVAHILRRLQAPEPAESAPLIDIGKLANYERPLPDIQRYDAWLAQGVH